MDRLQVASGERVSESESEDFRERRLAYAAEVLDHLMNFVSIPNFPKDEAGQVAWRQDWIKRLSNVPHWKLMKLDEFVGPYITDVWKFFDELKTVTETYDPPKQLPEPKSEIGKDFLEHIKKTCAAIGEVESPAQKQARWQAEFDSYKRLDAKYPHLRILSQVRTEKRFRECK